MAHKRIGIDVDGVLAQFTDAFSALIVEITKRDLFPPRPFDPPCWHYPQHYGYTHKELSEVWRQIADSWEFWRQLPAHRGAVKPCQVLLAWTLLPKHDVYFLTTRKGETAKRQTEEWLLHDCWPASLERPTPTVLVTDNKPYAAVALNLDILIDDYHQNTQQVALAVPACHTYLLNRSWNANEQAGLGVIRVDTLEEMFQREGL